MFDEIATKRDELAALCQKHDVRKLAVFGSAIRDDFDPERSDIDFRVEFLPVPIEIYGDNYFGFEKALEELSGRSVDLLSAPEIKNRYLRAEIESTQATLYAA